MFQMGKICLIMVTSILVVNIQSIFISFTSNINHEQSYRPLIGPLWQLVLISSQGAASSTKGSMYIWKKDIYQCAKSRVKKRNRWARVVLFKVVKIMDADAMYFCTFVPDNKQLDDITSALILFWADHGAF